MNSKQQTKREWQIPQLFLLDNIGATRGGTLANSFELHCTNTVADYSAMSERYFPSTSGGQILNDSSCGAA